MITARKKILSEATWILLGQVVSVIGGIATIRVLTEYLEPSEYGNLVLYLSFATLANLILVSGAKSGIERFYPIANEAQDLRAFLNAATWLMVYCIIVILIAGLALIMGIAWFDQMQLLGLAVALLVFSIVNGCNSTLNGLQNAARQRGVVALHLGLNAWLKLLLAVIAILYLGPKSVSVVIGYLIATLLVTISQLMFLKQMPFVQDDTGTSDRNWVADMWTYSWPFSAWAVFVWLQQVSDKWALNAFSSAAEVGLYAVVFQLGYATTNLIAAMTETLIGPILFQKAGSGKEQKRNQSVKIATQRIATGSLLVTTFTFALGLFWHEQILSIAVAEEYRSSSVYLPWMISAGGIFATGQLVALKVLSDMKSKDLLVMKISTALLAVALNMLGAFFFGISGIVVALNAFGIIYFLWIVKIAVGISHSSQSQGEGF